MPTPPRTKREYLRELVADKNRWSRPLTDEERGVSAERRFPNRHLRKRIPRRIGVRRSDRQALLGQSGL